MDVWSNFSGSAMRLIFAVIASSLISQAFAFSLSEEEEKANRPAAPRPRAAVSKVCKDALANKRVVVIIGERSGGRVNADQSAYGGMFQIINDRLRAQGVRTYTPEEIKKQVAQAEIDAYFRNDPDAALAASKKLGADHVLRGVIASHRSINPILKINEVAVNMSFTLADASGQTLSSAGASADSYSGSDVYGMALTLVREQADSVVNRLVSGLCNKAAGRKNGG